MQRFIAGQSIRKIAREEGRDRATVTKIVRSSEVEDYIREIREQYFGLGQLALAAVRTAIREEKDGRLAYQLLKDIGVVPSSAERNLSNIQAQQQAEEDSEEARVQTWMGRLIRVVFEKSRVYGTPIGDPLEDALHSVGVKFDPETGKFTEIGKES
jgi:predicted transcriptional regulator